MSPNSARLFVDLIRKATGDCFANWVPSRKIEVGDYGIIQKQTGEFEREGSIYDPDFHLGLDIKALYPPEKQPQDDEFLVTSRNCKSNSLDASLQACANLIHCDLTGSWEVEGGRGAIVMAIKPTITTIRDIGKLLPLLKSNETLAKKALVTSVYACPRYALHLTNNSRSKTHAAAGFKFDGAASASIRGQWYHHSTNGVWKTGGENGTEMFHPLFTLRMPKTQSFLKRLGLTRAEALPEGEDTFCAYRPPWKELDEDGVEIPDDESEDDDDDDEA